jgi:hypothetical protein
MELYTIQMARYRLAEAAGIFVADTTVKSGERFWYFQPTKQIVYDHKYQGLTDAEYTEVYRLMMTRSFRDNHDYWVEFLKRDKVALACYCATGKFCHRHLLANYLEKAAVFLGLPLRQCGEITQVPAPLQGSLLESREV